MHMGMTYHVPYETEFIILIVLLILGVMIAKRIIQKRQKTR